MEPAAAPDDLVLCSAEWPRAHANGGNYVLNNASRSAPSLRFFVAASTWAAIGAPLWLLVWTGHLDACRNCDPVAHHAHEMLAGYGWAVIAGFLATRASSAVIWWMLLLWAATRVAMTIDAGWMLAAPASVAFAALLFATAGMPFARSAKTAQNLIFAPLIGFFTVADLLYWLGAGGLVDDIDRKAALLMLGLIALLLFVMGGRITPVATVGALRRRGIELERRPSPRAEWTGIVGLGLVGLGHVFGFALPAGIGALAAGAAALYRLAHWRPFGLPDRPDVWSLHLGYGWLGIGLVLLAGGHFGLLPIALGVHALGVGALGTLAYAMMIRATQQRTKRPIRFNRWLATGCLLISVAAILRILGSFAPSLMIGGAACWSIAYLGLAIFLLRCILTPANPRRLHRER